MRRCRELFGRAFCERFRLGESRQAACQVGGGCVRVEGSVLEGHGNGVGHIHSAGMRVMQRGGKRAPVGVRHQAGVDSAGQRLPAVGVRGCGEPIPDLCGESELLVGEAGWVVVPGPDERRDAGADDIGVDIDLLRHGVDGGFPCVDGLGGDDGRRGEGRVDGGKVGKALVDKDVGQWSSLVEGIDQVRGAAGGHEFGGIGAVRQGGVARLEELWGEDPVVPLCGHLAGHVRVRGNDRVDAVAPELGGLLAGQVGAERCDADVAVQMPSDPSVIRFYVALLAALGAPLRPRQRLAELEQATLTLLRAVGVRVLVIDELHNLLAGRGETRREFLNLIRFLGNELRIPLVGVCTREAYLAIRSDDQLENRFEPFTLPRWKPNEGARSLLASFAAAFPLRRPSTIATEDMARYLLSRSEGTIGELTHLLTDAAVAAIESGEEAINQRTLLLAPYVGPTERRRMFERELA